MTTPGRCDVLRAAGKQPVVLEREIDGFLGNRLQFAFLREEELFRHLRPGG